jgi:hypothetical protein
MSIASMFLIFCFIVSLLHHKSSPTLRLLLTESFFLFDSNHFSRPPLILGLFAKLAKTYYWLRHVSLSIRLFAWNISVSTERIFVAFDI